MKIKLPILCLVLLSATPMCHAYDPLYTVTLHATPAFEIVGHDRLAFFPFSENVAPLIRKKNVRRLLAADATSLVLRSEKPREVLSQVIQQIAEQTGLKLSSVSNSGTPPTAPVFFHQGLSDTVVITLLLVPAENGLYHLTCHYIIDERPEGSNDGTPAGIAEIKETNKQIQEWQAKRKAGAAAPK